MAQLVRVVIVSQSSHERKYALNCAESPYYFEVEIVLIMLGKQSCVSDQENVEVVRLLLPSSRTAAREILLTRAIALSCFGAGGAAGSRAG